ncbi:hypothetical protein [Nocardioides panacisoli]|uniref:Uncharacterized protein n=1 Tax=Nocardioides panacisoli TaxID=627624 RepID=A0ABP7HXV1_9ACTN
MSTDVVEAVVRVHGGVKFYRGAAKAARAYVERDRSRADDYYLGEGSGVARRLVATPRRRLTGRRYERGSIKRDVRRRLHGAHECGELVRDPFVRQSILVDRRKFVVVD